jgi:hypothetical protein
LWCLGVYLVSGIGLLGQEDNLASGVEHIHERGPEIPLKWCTRIVVDDNAESEARMTPEDENTVNSITTAFSGRSLQIIGFAYRDLVIWPSENSSSMGTVGNIV